MPRTDQIRLAAASAASSSSSGSAEIVELLARIADALERAAPSPPEAPDFAAADAFVWHADARLVPVPKVSRVEMALLRGIDRVRDMLVENTDRFARGLPAN